MNTLGSDANSSVNRLATSQVEIGHYRGVLVAVKRLTKIALLLNRKDQLELKQARSLDKTYILNILILELIPPDYVLKRVCVCVCPDERPVSREREHIRWFDC